LARLPNDSFATQSLQVTGGSLIEWARGGSSPEISQVIFETSDGGAWIQQGVAENESGVWHVTDPEIPASAWLRARGIASSGFNNGSSYPVEEWITYGSGDFPDISLEQPAGTNLVSHAAVDFWVVEMPTAEGERMFTIRNDG